MTYTPPTQAANMGGYPSKDETKIIKAENYHCHSLQDSSFSILNVHASSGIGGALFVIVILLLAGIGYAIARYRVTAKARRARALVSLDVDGCVKPA